MVCCNFRSVSRFNSKIPQTFLKCSNDGGDEFARSDARAFIHIAMPEHVPIQEWVAFNHGTIVLVIVLCALLASFELKLLHVHWFAPLVVGRCRVVSSWVCWSVAPPLCWLCWSAALMFSMVEINPLKMHTRHRSVSQSNCNCCVWNALINCFMCVLVVCLAGVVLCAPFVLACVARLC